MKQLIVFQVFAVAFSAFSVALPEEERADGLQWIGSNESGAEFASSKQPGTVNKDYTFPNVTSIDILISRGMNIFRIPFNMERMAPTGMTNGLNSTYLQGISEVVTHITSQGVYAVLDAHNYDNEFHDMNGTLIVQLNQAAINGIREAGATSQYIFVEGGNWTGAWTWPDVNDAMKTLNDPSDKIVYEMHQYLNSDGSGTNDTCVNSTIGEERILAATAWLKENGKQGIIGEFAGGNNTVCFKAIDGMLKYMSRNTDVWKGAIWWAAGPWWGNYMFSLEPPTGIAYKYYMTTLLKY